MTAQHLRADICVVGGGLVGLATALKCLQSRPDLSVVVLEKETETALHQSGRNSGVIHAGVYYTPGSRKAEFCRKGLVQTKAFCTEHGVKWDECGKLIVATDRRELQRVDALYERGVTNGVPLERIDAKRLTDLEPHVRGAGGLLSPETGIADYRGMAEAMVRVITECGGQLVCGATVTAMRETAGGVQVSSSRITVNAGYVVVCAGLQADRLARIAGLKPDFRIVPFRGEYFQLPPERNRIVKHLIYPAPDPSVPFLGIHLTRMIDGSVTVGPNARVAFARESYGKLDFNFTDTLDFGLFPGFWKFVGKHMSSAAHEMRVSLIRKAYLREVNKYCPELTLDDLRPYRAGHRAQAIDLSGAPIEDFHFLETERMIHVCNAPSPAATSALPIGEDIAGKVLNRFSRS
ncbi:L-2-hydroxyglutarate oxidase [Pelagibacterium sediminicola]|uniref:L-2-hydroxyglutarate oxidase n=1 Tax=Pelagibacterium sediminicola TaxID=2248761 RepID=UPI0018E4F540|nr:L-2-hydroxyglutarate oxidase [Pelagibacterium sediminicola]